MATNPRTVDDAIAFFAADGYRFDPFERAYYAMLDGWKHDLFWCGEEYPEARGIHDASSDFTREDWARFIDALTARFREGLIAGLDASPWVEFDRKRLGFPEGGE